MKRPAKPHGIWLPLLIGLSVAAAATPLLAQTPFSLVNLGANVASYDARMEGRGGWGLAETDTLVPGFKNLAGLAEVDNVVLLLNGYFERRSIETVTTEAAGSRKTARVLTPNARVAFPLKGKHATLSAGFLSRRATEYISVKPNSWLLGDVVVIGEEQFERRGTQFEIPLAFSLRLLRGLSIAASLNLISGNIRQTVTDIFLQPTDNSGRPLYRPAENINRYEFSGVSGSSYVLFSPFRWLHLGGAYTPSHHVTVEQTQFLDGVASQAKTKFKVLMPMAWGAGLSIDLGSRWRIGCDYEFQEFSQLQGYEPWESDLDEEILSAGLEIRPARKRGGGLSNLPFRIGVLWHRWGYPVGDINVAGAINPVEEYRFSIGTGFMFRNGMGSLDISLGYGLVGSVEENSNEDEVWRLGLSISGLEKWWE